MAEVKIVQKVDQLDENQAKIFNLSKEEALERLKNTINPKTEKPLSESEQMLNKWCRDGDISAVRVFKGAPKDRGLRISEKSLEAFILTKTGKVEELLEELLRTKQELQEAREEIKELKQSGIRKPRKTTVKLNTPFLILDTLHFTMDRAKHQATFKDGKLIKIERNTRKGFVEVTDLPDEVTEAILKEKIKQDKKKQER